MKEKKYFIDDEPASAEDIIKKAHDFEIEAQIIGHVENSSKKGVNQVDITDPLSGEILKYEK